MRTRQNIFHFLKGYSPLISLINDFQSQLTLLLENDKIEPSLKELFLEVFEKVYGCLSSYCYRNINYQIKLCDHLDLFLNEMKYNYGQMDLINIIFSNSKLISEKYSFVLNSIKRSILEFGRQERFIKFFEVFFFLINRIIIIVFKKNLN